MAVLGGSLTLACSSMVSANNHTCADIPGMKLKIDEYHLELDDKDIICVPVPSDFSIRVKGKGGYNVSAGQVSVAKKANSGGPNVTITGDNSVDKNYLVVKVRGAASVGTPVSFLIDVDNVGVLDPKIRIIDNSIYLQYQEDALYALAEALGATITTLEFGAPTWRDDE